MRHSPIVGIALIAILLPALAWADAKSPSRSGPQADADETIHFVVPGENTVLTSTTGPSQLLLREAAGPDTFDLYGGQRRILRDPDGVPGNGDEYVEGKFEDETGFVPRGLSPNPGDWTGVDLTDQPVYWSVDTFNAENLASNGAGNRAMWSGLPAGIPETAGWEAAPGYGNNWNDVLRYESDPVADPSAGQTVGLDFFFNLDTEPGYDFLTVAYDSAGTWITVYERDGTNKDALTGVFPAPGLQYAAQPAVRPIVFAGDDYGLQDRIRIEIAFRSDGAFADEDGFFDGEGAVQLDEIVLTTNQGTFTEDFEGAEPYLFEPAKAPFSGDFATVFARVTDLDPCAENVSPQLGFVDFGQEPPNGPGTSGRASTGGSLSPTWDYGIPGGFVVNYTGGLDGVPLNNEAWSPEFDWDLPGTADDDVEISGASYEFSVYRHNPLINGLFYVWHVRSFKDGAWGPWVDRNFVFFSATPNYLRTVNVVTDLVPQDPERIQLAVGTIDLAVTFAFPGNDATPAPFFDDVRFRKFRIGGVPLATRNIDLTNDGFPVSGQIDASTQAARDLLDVRFDMARDISSGDLYVPGDSIIVDAAPVLPGTSLADIRMQWALRLNPLFESAIRQVPSRPQDEDFASTVDGSGREIWTGSVVMDSSRTASGGNVIDGRYFADLPDTDFLYPGDLLHYYVQATDSDGRVTTLPADTGGFGQWNATGGSAYSRTFTVRALPTISDATGSQPDILVYNDFGRRGAEEETAIGFGQIGLLEGLDYDTYTVQGPSSGVSNGIGSAGVTNSLGDRRGHGANADQLSGYRTIFYLSGNLNAQLISDGSDNGQNDKSPDLQVLTSWKNLTGPRNTVYFGDFIGSALVDDSPVDGAVYTSTVMGIDVVSSDVRPDIGGQTAPTVRPTGNVAAFDTPWIAFGGCFGINQFDHLRPSGTAVAGHGFVDPASDTLYPDVAASVVFDRVVGVDRKVDITFPFGFQYVYDDVQRRLPGPRSARSELLDEILGYLGYIFLDPPATGAPEVREASLGVRPNPFNPITVVRFALPRAGVPARVEVFNVRGERVKVLHDGVAEVADLRLEWNGTDDRGRVVGSGVYLVKAVTEGFTGTKKAVLVK